MKKAVISTGSKQYLVTEGDVLDVELLNLEEKSPVFTPLLVIDGDKTTVGTPEVSSAKVTTEIVEQEVKADKVVSIRYKSKKRVHKLQGHRQKLSRIKIVKIA
jgi:large subunit ribosomal protein L21